MTYEDKIAGLIDAAESNMADGDHNTICDNLCEALEIINYLLVCLDTTGYDVRYEVVGGVKHD